jgi:hypothetical protein
VADQEMSWRREATALTTPNLEAIISAPPTEATEQDERRT